MGIVKTTTDYLDTYNLRYFEFENALRRIFPGTPVQVIANIDRHTFFYRLDPKTHQSADGVIYVSTTGDFRHATLPL
jgi:hypothetical protein